MAILVLESDERNLRWYLKRRATGQEAYGTVTDIATEASTLRLTDAEGKESILLSEANDIPEAVEWLRDVLLQRGLISAPSDLRAIGQYVAHGGSRFRIPTLITDDLLLELDRCKPYAPTLMEANLSSIAAAKRLFPGVPQVAVFDTAFFQTLPEHAALYPIPYDYIRKHRIRRYGFHGILHAYLARRTVELAGLDPKKHRIITVELGPVVSLAAVRNGAAVETSTGFGTLDGPCGLESSGTVGFDALTFLAARENMGLDGLHTLLHRFSGLVGLSGGLHSMDEILSAVEKGDETATVAYQAFLHSVRRHIGAFLPVLGGLDALTLSGDLAQNHPRLREDLLADLQPFGLVMDTGLNRSCDGSDDQDLSAASSTVRVLYVRRNTGRALFEETEKLL